MTRNRGAPLRRHYRKWLAIAAIALLASACGRKGDPLPPPDASATAAPKASGDANTPGGLAMAPPPNPPIARPDKPFLLDPLLK